ncbi:MAG: hypothetical protein J6386_17840 [Candidatus Synoicihabitans palmerolidicus]|nr:hypothetical protein [Candidatus Synoicihabitans palmerolidicus]
MNDERFIKLLNSYIDRELSAINVIEIEKAITASPKRQTIYAQYCKIERACQNLLGSSSTVAPQPVVSDLIAAARTQNEGDLVPFPAELTAGGTATRIDSRPIWGMAVGLMAACVVVAVYFGNLRTGPSMLASNLESSQRVASTTSGQPVGIDDAAADSENAAYRTVFMFDQTTPKGTPSLRIAATGDTGDPLAWMAQMTFEPIRPVEVDSLEFKRPHGPIKYVALVRSPIRIRGWMTLLPFLKPPLFSSSANLQGRTPPIRGLNGPARA